MRSINAKTAREQFSSLMDAVARGQSVTITRRGKPIAKISPVNKASGKGFPDLTEFRASLKGGGGTATIEDLRRLDRY